MSGESRKARRQSERALLQQTQTVTKAKPTLPKEFTKAWIEGMLKWAGFDAMGDDVTTHSHIVNQAKFLRFILGMAIIFAASGFLIKGCLDSADLRYYQRELDTAKGKLSGLQEERDVSAKAVKKRAKILSSQIVDFLNAKNNTNQWRGDLREKHMKYFFEDYVASGGTLTNNSIEKVAEILGTEEKKWYEGARAYFNQELGEFIKTFFGRLVAVRDQLADLGIQSPRLDEIINKRERSRNELRECAEELQKLSDRVKE